MPLPKVRIIQPIAGVNYTYQSGEVVELPAPLCAVWVERGLAEYVEKPEGVKPSGPRAKRGRKAKLETPKEER